MRILVSGSRNWNSFRVFDRLLYEICLNLQGAYGFPKSEFEIVNGAAKGVDEMACKFGKQYGLKVKLFPAEWDNLNGSRLLIKQNKYGERYNALAGIIRNQKMLEYVLEGERNGLLVAFRLDYSRGTTDMIQTARRAKLPMHVFDIWADDEENPKHQTYHLDKLDQ